MQTIFWHDYETFGADPQRDRPCQFAGVRTDLELNIIEEPITIFSKPTEDYLPSVQACLVTGITPQKAMAEGVSEAQFAKTISEIFCQAETCVAGYNSVRFDDEVSRNLFYRNFYDPYEREWKNGNSRWDIIDVVRLAYALRPEGINWPTGDDGKVSFRLEKLTEANGIVHEAAHDAMSDVYATIELAKLIKQKQPALYKFAFDMRSKTAVQNFLDQHQGQPFLHVSSKIAVDKGCIGMMYPLMPHPTNKNAIIAFDLRQDPNILLQHSSDEIKALLYQKTELDSSGNPVNVRPALKLIHLNKCPMLAPASMIKVIPDERLKTWGLDLNIMREHVKLLKADMSAFSHVREVFVADEDRVQPTDPDLMIYSGGFFSPQDKAQLTSLRNMPPEELEDAQFAFQDSRLEEMLFRYKARNYPEVLSSEERAKWSQHCMARLLGGENGYLNFDAFAKDLQSAAQGVELGSDKAFLLEEIQLYAESIYPY